MMFTNVDAQSVNAGFSFDLKARVNSEREVF